MRSGTFSCRARLVVGTEEYVHHFSNFTWQSIKDKHCAFIFDEHVTLIVFPGCQVTVDGQKLAKVCFFAKMSNWCHIFDRSH